MQPQRIVCGIRPTGSVHIGNYYGAIKPAVTLAKDFPQESFFFIADLHAITSNLNPASSAATRQRLAAETLSTAALYIAAGQEAGLEFSSPTANSCNGKINLFVQSHVPQVSELARLLGSITSVGMLKRMIQFKEKSRSDDGDQGESASLALFDYPVLMAADILVYGASHVPVGDDQRQHLELARDLAQRFNKLYGKKLTVPLAYVSAAARIKSLSDGNCKMSKSDSNDNSRINLLDSPELIARKIKRARTDSIVGLEFDNEQRPEVHNLLSIYALASGKARGEIAESVKTMGGAAFKELLSQALIADLSPVQERYNKLMQNPEQIMAILQKGAVRANFLAGQTLHNCRQAMGFLTTL